MWADYRGKAVLVTGGTRGIGLACARAFARHGADVYVTHWWGTTSPAALAEAFEADGLAAPTVLEADVSSAEDTAAVMKEIRRRHEHLHAFVSNVAFAAVVRSLDDLVERSFVRGMQYSAWPVVAYTLGARETFGRSPRYVVATSSQGAGSLHEGYDLVAASKAALEALCRYLAHRLHDEGTRVNVLRTRFCDTDALRATFGERFVPFVEHHAPGLFTDVQTIGEAAFGLCSGLMDAMNGQILDVDGGAAIFDGFSRLFEERDRLPPKGRD